MATLKIEGVPVGLLLRLAGAAAANGRCVNSEVILSLVRHLCEDAARNEAGRRGTIVCPLRPCFGAEVPTGRSVSWGDPG